MLKSYWPAYKQCPDCGGMNKNNKAYYKCSDPDCDYTEKAHIISKKREQRVKPIIKEMVKYLLGNDKEYNEPFPVIQFLSDTKISYDVQGKIISGGGYICQPGWYAEPPIREIYIPQKTFYLPNKEIVEVISHESAHASTHLNHEDEKWHHKYMDYRKEAFSQYSWFINEPDNEARYTLNFSKEFYKKAYGFTLEDLKIKKEDLKYDPYEDD